MIGRIKPYWALFCQLIKKVKYVHCMFMFLVFHFPHPSISVLLYLTSLFHLAWIHIYGWVGVGCSSGVLQTKARRVWVKLLWPSLFISSRLWLKHWLWPFKKSAPFSLTNCKAFIGKWKYLQPCSARSQAWRTGLSASDMKHLGRNSSGPNLGWLKRFSAVWITYLLFCLFTLDCGQ